MTRFMRETRPENRTTPSSARSAAHVEERHNTNSNKLSKHHSNNTTIYTNTINTDDAKVGTIQPTRRRTSTSIFI